MIKQFIFIQVIIVLFLISCTTPSAIKSNRLVGIENQSAVKASSIMSDSANIGDVDGFYESVLIGSIDSSYIFAWCDEYPDLIAVTIYFFNNSGEITSFYPEDCFLKDSYSILFTQLMPHEAANIIASQTTAIPPYMPKYNYEMTSSSTGNFDLYNYGGGYYSGYYNENTDYDIEVEEDPYNKLGYTIGAAIMESQNRKLTQCASYLYNFGLINCSIPNGSAIYGSLYWIKKFDSYPIEFVFNCGDVSFNLKFDRESPSRK